MTATNPTAGDDQPDPQISLQKSDESQALLKVEHRSDDLEKPDRAAGLMSRGRRVVASAATARDRTAAHLAALLVPLIKATRYPLLIVVLLAAVPAVAVMLIALLRPGADDPFWLVLGAAGLLIAGWMALRRHQLLAVAQDQAALATALASLVDARDIRDQLVRNVSVGRVATAAVRKSRPMRILRGMWRGVQMTGIIAQIIERPELAPLMPGRLRGMWFLGVACLISFAVLGVAVLLTGFVYLLGG
jgi:hypothetical protein